MPVILAIWEAEIRRIVVSASPGKKSWQKPTSTEKNWAQWHTSVILVTVGIITWEDCYPGRPGPNVTPYLQNSQSKKGWRCGSNSSASA
jgi:hypothetical protein